MSMPLDPDTYFDLVLRDAEPGGFVRRGPVAEWRSWWQRLAREDGLLRCAASQGFVVRTSQLRDLGVTRGAERHAVAVGRWTRAGRGVVAPLDPTVAAPTQWTVDRRRHALHCAAAVLGRDGLVVSGQSAAVLSGLPVHRVPGRSEVTDLRRSRTANDVPRHAYRAALRVEEVESWFGVPLTTAARTIVDLARHHRWDGIMAVDAALRERVVTRAELDAALAGARGWVGVRRAREVVALGSPLAESPLESVVRLALYESGIPAPRLQVAVGAYRVDMMWPAQRLVLEVDGLGKYDAREWRREKQREQDLRELGYRVERVIWDDVLRRWPVTVARLSSALCRQWS